MLKKLIMVLLPVFFATGCIAERYDDCISYRLRFRYTYNSDGVDRLAAHVGHIRLYVFDLSTERLAEVIEVGSEEIARGYIDINDLPDGRYTFVAWGSSNDELSRSFVDSHVDATTQLRSDIEIGRTSLSDFYMMLDCEELPVDVHGDIAPSLDTFDDLFFAKAEGIAVARGANRQVDFDFIRNTNVLKVAVTGLDYLTNYDSTRGPSANQPLHVFVTGRNGRYRYDNTIDIAAPVVRYEPPCHTLTAATMGIDIKTMHLSIDRHTDDPILLHVHNAALGHPMIAPIDVLDAIRRAQDTRGEILYPDQEAIDRQYEFPFEISILADLSVKITVDSWEVIDTEPDMD